MGKLKILSEGYGGDGYVKAARDIMSLYGKGYKSDWRIFIDKVLKYVYEPLGRYGRMGNKVGVLTEDGQWHPVLNRINTNYLTMSKLLEESGVNPNSPTELIYSTFINFFRQNYRSIVSEDGELYKKIILPIIGRTSEIGDNTESEAVKVLKDCPLFFGLNIEQIGGVGVDEDMVGGVDAVAYKTTPTNPTYTIQIKPFTYVKQGDYGHFINGVGQAKDYKTNFICFYNNSKIIITDASRSKPKQGYYFISRGGIKWQKGVDTLNEDFDIMRNTIKFL